MLSQLFTVITVLGVVSAAPGGITQCNTGTNIFVGYIVLKFRLILLLRGPVQCCSNLQTADSPVSNTLGGILGAALGPVDALIGLGCTPITVM